MNAQLACVADYIDDGAVPADGGAECESVGVYSCELCGVRTTNCRYFPARGPIYWYTHSFDVFL